MIDYLALSERAARVAQGHAELAALSLRGHADECPPTHYAYHIQRGERRLALAHRLMRRYRQRRAAATVSV